jgi:hypothetical protein
MELASSLALRRVCRAAVAGSSLVRRHTRAAVHVRCLSGSPPREPWWSKLNPFKKLDPEAKRVKDEKHEIIMERLRRSVFYDAKQAPTEKVRAAAAFRPCGHTVAAQSCRRGVAPERCVCHSCWRGACGRGLCSSSPRKRSRL